MWTVRGFAQVLRQSVVGLVGAIVCCSAGAASAEGPLMLPGTQLEPVKWSQLAGWTADDHLAAFAAYQSGCRVSRKMPRTDDSREIHGALGNVCRKAIALQPRDAHTARAFFEQNFQPVRIAPLGGAEGLLTGYFEPIVAGSRFPNPEFPVPLYRRPRDLVAAGYHPGSPAFPNKGVRIGRRTGHNELVPYHDRGAIEAGALDGQKLEICWLKDPFDLLALQMEGSGRVILEDGTPLRVSYDSHNGYNYSSFERVLVERNLMSRKEMSREHIRAWMAAYPEEAANARATNRSYAFFRVTGLTNEGEPVGAQGVPLTPGRSIAVDRIHEYGTLFFIEGKLPIEGVKPAASPFRRLMIAQDTGSAITGPARADLYFGAGDDASRIASRIRHSARFVMLLPRELDMIAAGNKMPLPVPRPKTATIEVAKRDGTTGARAATDGRSAPKPKLAAPAAKTKIATPEPKTQDGKRKVETARSGGSAVDRPEPLPAPKSKLAAPAAKTKIATPEPKTQDGKRKVETARSGGSAVGRPEPLPAPKSKSTGVEVKKPDGKGEAETAGGGAIAAGSRQKPPPATKPNTPRSEVRRQDGKREAEGAGAASDGKAAKSGRQAVPLRKSYPL